MNCACFPKEKHPNSQKKCEIHELSVSALSLVWFAGAIPDPREPHSVRVKLRFNGMNRRMGSDCDCVSRSGAKASP